MIGAPAMWVAVLGGAHRYDTAQLRAAYRCGVALARGGCNVMTGATTGVPYAAAVGAKDAGGMVVGVSPATSPREHVEQFGKPITATDLVLYSGLTIEGRSPLIMRSVSAAIFIGGEMGTLAEFAAGWLCGCRYMGLLETSGGITANLGAIADSIQTNWGSTIIRGSNPEALVAEICARLDDAEVAPWIATERATVADVLATIAELRPC